MVGRKHTFVPNEYTRFLRRVSVNGFNPRECWAWEGAGKGNGYGHLSFRGSSMGAHRAAYLLFCGEISQGLDVCHSCDNRCCVNPDHLYLGTRQDNMDDCRSKGRACGGARKHLREHQVQEIRRRANGGHSLRKISEQMNIAYSAVRSVVRGETYVGIGQ